MKFSLLIEGQNVCDLSFDAAGKSRVSLSNLNDVHKFCRTMLSIIDGLPEGVKLVDQLPIDLRPE
jgi:hypothetical protein